MATSYTSLLGFALPVTGELQGTWGDTVNNSITQLCEDSIAGVATASVLSSDWTLTTTGAGAANQARMAILIPTGSPGVSRNIIAPSKSKTYTVINQSNAAVVIKGAATTGVSVASGDTVIVAWNGSDFVAVKNADGTFTNLTYTGTLTGSTGVMNIGSGQLYKDSSGNVGIGTSSPSSYGKLVVYGDSPTAGVDLNTVNASATGIARTLVTGSGGYQSYLWQAGTSFNTYHSITAGNAGIYATTNLSYEADGGFYQSWWTNGTERMRIDSSGNVGIGTSSPSNYAKFAVRGYILSGAQNNSASFSDSVNSTLTIGHTSGSANLISDAGLSLYSSNTERMRLDSSGNVGIGTSSPSASAILDAQSTSKGVRFPNMTTTQKNAIASPSAGLVVFDTTLAKLCVYSGSAWQTITSV